MTGSKFCVCVLRNATVYGLSKRRMRFDLIVNMMTLHAWKNNRIIVMGGGKQWRPLVHINDVIQAFRLIILAKERDVNEQIFNVGSNSQNYQVFQVSNFFKKFFPSLIVEVAPDDTDPRSYHVKFDKIQKGLKFECQYQIEHGIKEIKTALENGEITDHISTNTGWYYKYLIDADQLLTKVKIDNKLFSI